MGEMLRIMVRSLDVWGHAPGGKDCDCERDENDEPTCRDMGGFEVNDSYAAGRIEVSSVEDDYEDSRIIAALIDGGFLKEEARVKVRLEGYVAQERAVVESIDDGMPLYWLDSEGDWE